MTRSAATTAANSNGRRGSADRPNECDAATSEDSNGHEVSVQLYPCGVSKTNSTDEGDPRQARTSRLARLGLVCL